MAGGGSGRLHDKPFWPESDKSNSPERGQATSWIVPCMALELRRGHIAQSRVKPLLIINSFDKFVDGCVSLSQISIFGSVNLLIFERLEETFGLGVGMRCQLQRIPTVPTVFLKSFSHTIR